MSVNTRDIKKQLRHWKLKMFSYYEKIMKKLWFLKNIIFVKTGYVFLKKKHSMVIFQRKKTYGYFSKKKKTEYEFSYSLLKKPYQFFFILHKQNLFLSTEINRIKQDMVFSDQYIFLKKHTRVFRSIQFI